MAALVPCKVVKHASEVQEIVIKEGQEVLQGIMIADSEYDGEIELYSFGASPEGQCVITSSR